MSLGSLWRPVHDLTDPCNTSSFNAAVQARRLLQGGAYLNNVPLSSESATTGVLSEDDVATFRDRPEVGIVLLRKGKRTAKVLLLV